MICSSYRLLQEETLALFRNRASAYSAVFLNWLRESSFSLDQSSKTGGKSRRRFNNWAYPNDRENRYVVLSRRELSQTKSIGVIESLGTIMVDFVQVFAVRHVASASQLLSRPERETSSERTTARNSCNYAVARRKRVYIGERVSSSGKK